MIKTNIFKKWREKMSFLTARKNAGLTQKEVADQIGVDQTAVSFWENGKTLPRASLLSKIAMIYGVTVDELLSDRGEG
jgi:transcriptional regulator with XRE-family HTH domain